MSTDIIETKRRRWDRAVKLLVLMLIGCIVGPFALFGALGLGAIFLLWVVSEVLILFTPVLSAWLANKRIQAFKAVAAANPIETYENQYLEKSKALEGYKTALAEFYASIQEVFRNIEAHYEQFPGRPCKFDAQFQRMLRGLENRQKKFKRLKKALKEFDQFIKEKKSEWRVAQSLAKSNKLAQVGDDFLSTLMKDEATQTITTALDTAFAEMDASMLDEQIEQELAEEAGGGRTVAATVVTAAPAERKALPARIQLPTLDLGDDDAIPESNEEETVLVPARGRAGRR